MLKKYGLKADSPKKKGKIDKKRKVVELANICENKQKMKNGLK